MPSFGDLYKPVKDFFGKVYVADNRADLTVKAGQTKYTTFLEQKGTGSNGELTLENALTCCENKTKYKFTLNTSGRSTAKLTFEPRAVSGLELAAETDFTGTCEVSTDYKQGSLCSNTTFKCNKGATSVDSSLGLSISAFPGLSVGGSATYSPDNSLEKFSYGGQYQGSNHVFAFTVEDQQRLKAGCTVKTNCNQGVPVVIGAEYATNLSGKVESFTGGIQTRLSGQTVKAKLNQKGAAALALQTTLQPGLTATYGLQVNAFTGNNFKTAVKIEYEG